MWSISASRAGYRLNSWKTEEYSNRREITKADNLCITDWDARFLQLNDEPELKKRLLADLSKKLGATNQFAGRNHTQASSNIDFSRAGNHLYH